jgi:hypothetical protein
MENLNAKLLPLKDKHYGSQIELSLGNQKIGTIKVWLSTPFESDLSRPSTRELSSNGYKTVEEAVKDGFPCDSHYESELDYRISLAIQKALENVNLNHPL